MTVEARQLQAFIAVAEELSFVRAATRLHVAQPALSRTIRSLEAVLGVTLLQRTTRTVRLTEAGKVFLIQARNSLDQMERAVALAREAQAGLFDAISIGYMDFAIYGPMMRLLAKFGRENPRVKLSLQRRRSDEQSDDVAAERLDVGFTIRHRFRPELETVLLSREPLVAVLHRNHRLAGHERVSIADLADEPFVMGERRAWRMFLPTIEAFCGTVGYSPRVLFEANEGSSMFRLVAAGLGVSVYPACARRARQPGIVVREFAEDPPLIETFGVVRRDGYPPIVETLVKLVQDSAIAPVV